MHSGFSQFRHRHDRLLAIERPDRACQLLQAGRTALTVVPTRTTEKEKGSPVIAVIGRFGYRVALGIGLECSKRWVGEVG